MVRSGSSPKGMYIALASAAGAAAGVAATAAYTRYLALGEMPLAFKLQGQALDTLYTPDQRDNLSDNLEVIENTKRINMLQEYVWYLHDKLGPFIGGENPFAASDALYRKATATETLRENVKEYQATLQAHYNKVLKLQVAAAAADAKAAAAATEKGGKASSTNF